MRKLLMRLFSIDSEGVSVLKQLNAHKVHKVGFGQYQVMSQDLHTVYDFVYLPEDGAAELWSNRDLIYETEDAVEAMEMYLYLKGLYHSN